jgi:tetratricopeptide (TPR) repeat protein
MNEESLFHEALARTDRRERAVFLATACAGRPELRSAVESLLAVHDQSNGFLNSPAVADWVEDAAALSDSELAADAETSNKAGLTSRNISQPNPLSIDATLTVAPHESPAVPDELPPFIGRYAVRETLGRGGMGTVYLAHDPELDRLVALKVPQLGGPAAEERFLREARAAAAVTHPNLCPVFDAGRADGVLYLAMAYIPGTTLGHLLKDHGRMPPTKAAALAIGIARGMAEAHRHAIIHRDLKPGNVLLDRRGEPVVTDFGLARRDSLPDVAADPDVTGPQDQRLTQAGALMGTPAYMPPEQARGDHEQVGPASDVYALGAILFEMLTGRPPFRGDTVVETLRKIATDAVPPIPGVPTGLEAVCRRALARDPAARPPSMDAFADALAPFAKARRRSRVGQIAVAAAACLLLIAAGTVLYIKTDHGTVEVRLSDAAADVQVSVDGNLIEVTEAGRVTKLQAGAHSLHVTGAGFETDTREFKIKRGDRTIVVVELKAKTPKKDEDESSTRQRLAGLLLRGEQLIVQKRHRELEGVVEEALKVDPQSPTALALRANLRQRQGDVVRAKADAEAALKLNPETSRALLVLSYLFANEKKYDECIALESIIIRLRPNLESGWTNRADSYLQKKEFRQTIADAARAIAFEPKAPSPLLNRGAAYALLGDYEKALVDYDAAQKLAENNPQVYDKRAMVHAKMGSKEKADADWKKAEELDETLKSAPRDALPTPEKAPDRKKLTPEQSAAVTKGLATAQTAWDTGHIPDSKLAIDEALKIDPTSGTIRAWRARHMAQSSQFAEAIAEATEALRHDPTLTMAYTVRGVGHINREQMAAGIADLTIAVTIDAKNWPAWYNRGLAYMVRGQFHQALADFEVSLGLNPNQAEPYANRGVCYLSLGEYEKALDAYTRAADIQPANVMWPWVMASIQAKLGNIDEAARLKAHATKLNKNQPPEDISLPVPLPPVKKDPELPPDPVKPIPVDLEKLARLLARGYRLLDEGHIEKVGKVADEALTVDPQSPGALSLRAMVRAVDGDLDGARADADAALKLNPEMRVALIARGFANSEDGKPNEAIADETVAIRLGVNEPRAWANRSKSFIDREEYQQAIADATESIRLQLGGADALTCRAAAYGCLGEYAKALTDYDAAAKVDPNNWRVFDQRSALHAKMGNPAKEAADWAQAKKLNPTLDIKERVVFRDPPKPGPRKKLSATEATSLATALANGQKAWSQDRYPDCLRFAEEACRIDPTSSVAHSLRARVLGQQGRDRESMDAATEALRLNPADADALTNRGVGRARTQDTAGAIADHTIALQLAPKNPLAWNNRCYAYYLRGQFHQAIADINIALELRPNLISALANRGACLLALGEYEKALADYESAAKLQPTIGKWRMFCSVIKARLGDPEGSRKDRDEAFRLDPALKDAKPMTLPPPLPPVRKDPE